MMLSKALIASTIVEMQKGLRHWKAVCVEGD